MYRALETFAGKVSMIKDEVREILDKDVVNDLLRAGYIEEVKPTENKVKEEIKKVISKAKK